MRRKFILILLGIVCVSTLSSLFSEYTPIEKDKVLVDIVAGVVGAGNLSYWHLGHNGPLLVELISLSGDADIYVSDSIRPSYETDMNNFSSITCGPDTVSIPAEFPDQLVVFCAIFSGVGVFGHWSHSVSEYRIKVYLDVTTLLSEQQFQESERQTWETPDTENKKSREKAPSKKTEDDMKPGFLKLLNILDMIFEMFVL